MRKQTVKKRIISVVLIVALMTGLCATVSFGTTKKTGYVTISSSPVKVGKYYYKQKNYKILRSKKKNTGYNTVLKVKKWYFSTVITNGTYLYTVECPNYSSEKNAYYLVRYKASGKNRKVVKKLPFSSEDYLGYWELITTAGNNIVLCRGDGINWKVSTYRYNIKSKKLKKIINNNGAAYAEKDTDGAYVICERYFDTSGIVANIHSLYKISNSGTATKLLDMGRSDATFIDGKLYYIQFEGDFIETYDDGYVNVNVYSCNKDGSDRELVTSFSKFYEYGTELHADIQDIDWCHIIIGDYSCNVNPTTGYIW